MIIGYHLINSELNTGCKNGYSTMDYSDCSRGVAAGNVKLSTFSKKLRKLLALQRQGLQIFGLALGNTAVAFSNEAIWTQNRAKNIFFTYVF